MRPICLIGLIGALAIPSKGFAQNEGRSLDVGSFVGLAKYQGDAKAGFLRGLQPTMGFSLRLNRNLRFSWRGALQYQRLSGSTRGLHYSFPRESNFATNILSLSWGGEYHWYPYGVQHSYLSTKRWTPYIGAGLGLSAAWQERFLLTPQLYVAGGVKLQLKPQLQLIVAYAWLYYLSDRLDALNANSSLDAPFGQRATAFRHGDSSSFISLGLSWKLKYKYLNCN